MDLLFAIADSNLDVSSTSVIKRQWPVLMKYGLVICAAAANSIIQYIIV